MRNSNQTQQLRSAIESRDLRMINSLIEIKPDINALTEDGSSLLIIASQKGYLEIVKLLLNKKANVNFAISTNLFTALHLATLNGHNNVVEELLANGADVKAKTINNFTALHLASQYGHLEIVRTLIKADPASLDQTTDLGVTSLNFAAKNGFLEIVRELISEGADVNIKTNSNNTALHSASAEGHLEVVKAILNAKPEDINSINLNGCTALHLSANYGHQNVVRELINLGKADVNTKVNDNFNALHLASKYGHLEVVIELINKGADIRSSSQDGFNALQYATQNGHLDIVKTILALDPNCINICNSYGVSALHIASYHNHPSIVKALIVANADISSISNGGFSAIEKVFEIINTDADIIDQLSLEQKNKILLIAISNNYFEVAKKLVENGADINTKNIKGLTPMNLATKNGNLEFVKFLVEKFQDQHQGDLKLFKENLEISLFFAVKNNHAEIVEFLVNQDINVNRKFTNKDIQEEDSLTIAVKLGHENVVKELLKSDKLSLKDQRINNVFEIAKQKGNQRIIQLLIEKFPEKNPSSSPSPESVRRSSQRSFEV
jgi:serine/threonine-protein phosphatase 6 regulatory ankyrin repeat subunit B